MRSLPNRLAASIRKRGVAGTVALGGRIADRKVQRWAHRRRERRFDRESGLETGGRTDHPETLADRPEFEHAVWYEGTTPRRFGPLIEALPIDRSQFTFVDLGCGRGKALLLAAELGFKRVVGVEFSSDLADAARENLHDRQALDPAGAEVVCGDAGSYELPPDPLVIYMFNPFGEPIVARVAANIERSLADRPRPVFVVYLHATHPAPLDESAALRRVPLAQELLAPPSPRGIRARLRHELADDLVAIVYEPSAADQVPAAADQR